MKNKVNNFRLSIPVKVVLITACAYLVLWLVGTLLLHALGLQPGIWFWLIEAALVGAVALWASNHYLETPMQRLYHVMNQAEEGHLHVRVPVLSDDEMGSLAQHFNTMLGRVEELSQQKSDALHEQELAAQERKFRRSLEEKGKQVEQAKQSLELLVKDLAVIYEIGQKINRVIDLEKLYEEITETLKRYLQIEEFALIVYDDKKEELVVRAASGFAENQLIIGTRFRRGEGISGMVATSGKKAYIRDTRQEKRFLHYKGEKRLCGASFLSIPLVYKDEVLGVINFGRKEVGAFRAHEVKMLSLVASQAALAIANAKLYTQTRELSVKDELTGAYNRRHFQKMLSMEWKRAVRFRRDLSLIMIDVDYFKQYNDSYGHLQGDVVLKTISQLFMKYLREVDTVARFGGEEFILLLPDTDKHGAMAVAEKLRKLVEQHKFLVDGQEGRKITVSLGVASFPDDVGGMDDLIDHADIALYRSKEKGRNMVTCFAAGIPKAGEPGADTLPEEDAESPEEKKKALRILQ